MNGSRIGHRGAIEIRHAVLHDRHGCINITTNKGSATCWRRSALHTAHGDQQFLQQPEHLIVISRTRTRRGSLAGCQRAISRFACRRNRGGFHIRQDPGVYQYLIGLRHHEASFRHHFSLKQLEDDQASLDVQRELFQTLVEGIDQLTRFQRIIPLGDFRLAFKQVFQTVAKHLQLFYTAITGTTSHVIQGHRGFQVFFIHQGQGVQVKLGIFKRRGLFVRVTERGKLVLNGLLQAGNQTSTLHAKLAHGIKVTLALAIRFLLCQVVEGVVSTIKHIFQIGRRQ